MSRRKDFIDSLVDGVSRMHRAAATQTEHQIRELLERGADPNVRNWRGETPLHRAAIRNPDLDVSRTLIGAGADPNAQDEKGATPLHCAAHNPSTGRAELLIEAGADVGARDNSGATPLHHAAESGHEAMIVRLVEAGADPNARDQAGRTPLRIAVEKGWSEGSQTLLNHGADPNVPDNEGQIPLHVAYAAKRQDMVNRLLEAGANLEARDGTGRVPIQHLHDPDDDRGRGEQEQEARANDRSQSFRTDRQELQRVQDAVNPADPEGRTPLHRAAEKGSYLGTHRLLQEGADPNITDKAGRTPLHSAAGSTDGSEAVERLLEARADPNFSQDSRGETPLHLAVRHDNDPSVDHLLEAKAHPGIADSEGRTPLHRAAENCAPDITEKLLRAGADPNVRDNAGRTPLELATARRERLDPSPRNDGAVRLLEKATVPQQEQRPASARPRRPKTRTEDYYKQFADDIITQIERGTAPWQKHWKPGENRMPENFSTGARYQGGNALQLMVKRTQRAYNDNRWGTYKQIKEAGGQVRKGERGTTVLVYKPPRRAEGTEATPGEVAADKPKNPDAEKTTRPMWKRYTVFNVEQADGLALPERAAPTPEWEALKNVENVIAANGVKIREVNGDRAYYNMAGDEIVLPERSQFKNAEGYYQTVLHEVGHSTGHPDRLNRESLQQGIQDGFGSEAYAREELRAEISAMMSSDRLGVAYEPQHATAYVKGWVEVLKDDPKEIYKAAAEASRISDYVCDAPERQRDKPIEKARDTPLVTSPEPGRGRPMPSPVVAHQPQPATPVPAKAPEIELSR